jgi:putative transposase
MDELTGVQAIQRKFPDLPMQPGHVLRREFEYIRHGTLSWFINFDVVTGEVIVPSWGPTRTEEDALTHLQRLIASDPQATKWRVMLDNLNTHQSEALVRWVAHLEGIPQETDSASKARAAFSTQWRVERPFCMTPRTRSSSTTPPNMPAG